MASIASQSIIVETPDSAAQSRKPTETDSGAALVGWITGKVNVWEDIRNRGYLSLWGEYWRMWRGMWTEADKNRLSERSKLVAPALAQAIEQTVSEIEEALFGRDEWFDAVDAAKNGLEQQLKEQLKTDLELVNAQDQIMEAVLNGAIFGTMIAIVNVRKGSDPKMTRDPATFELKTQDNQRVLVDIESIRPDEFIPDPQGRNIQQMLGCARRMQRTLHYVLEKAEQGVYRKEAVPALAPTRRLKNSDVDNTDPQSVNTTYESEQIDLIEYHGKVPASLILPVVQNPGELRKMLKSGNLHEGAQGPMVEAIVTLANTGVLLRAMVNPFTMRDRAIVAAQLEKVPGRFWGRGVAEKGYNPQKALDAELRARMDALGYISAPMLGVDAGRMPRGFRFEVRPGKVWPTNGPPNEILQPVKIGEYNTLTFEQTQEMERMVQMGTGSFDTASALKAQSQSGANGAGSNSMLMGAFVKRAKRSIANINRNFIFPLLQKSLWRYMQFDPVRYPSDFGIQLKPSLGIVAREVEAAQMTQLIGMLPDEYHQAKLILARGVVEHTGLSGKGQILQLMDKVLTPDPKQQQKAQQMDQLRQQAAQAQLQGILLTNKKTQAEIDNLEAQAHSHAHEATVNTDRSRQDWVRLHQQQEEQNLMKVQTQAQLERIPIDRMKAEAAIISAKANEHKAHNPPPRATAK